MYTTASSDVLPSVQSAPLPCSRKACSGRLLSICSFLRWCDFLLATPTLNPVALCQAARRTGSRESAGGGGPSGLRMQVWSNPQAVQDYKGKSEFLYVHQRDGTFRCVEDIPAAILGIYFVCSLGVQLGEPRGLILLLFDGGTPYC